MGACQSLVSAAVMWRSLPPGRVRRAKFRSEEIRTAGRFAGGLVAITALSVAVTQLDRIALSAMRPLVELGYFSLALSIAAGMGRMIQPMFNALYPRYSKLVSLGDDAALVDLYHMSNQCLSVVVGALSTILIIFSRDVVYLWTGDAPTAAKVAVPLSILVAGTALNGLMNLPYALQLAHGWTRLTAGANLVALILGIPFSIWIVGNYGISGAACLWFAINFGFVVVTIPLMHRRLMRGELATWYLRDMVPPFAVAAVVGAFCRWLMPALTRDASGALLLGAASAATLFAAALASPATRNLGRQQLLRFILTKT
jgi:O-antigen/teichoic acid export membrane protein